MDRFSNGFERMGNKYRFYGWGNSKPVWAYFSKSLNATVSGFWCLNELDEFIKECE